MSGVSLSGRAGHVRVEGLDGLLKSFNRLGPELNKEIRQAAKDVAKAVANDIKAAATTPQQKLAARTVRPQLDRVPSISAGGSVVLRKTRKLASGEKRDRTFPLTGSDIFFGAEFGGQARPTTMQFPKHLGRTGYFFWPTIRNTHDQRVGEYLDALKTVLGRVFPG